MRSRKKKGLGPFWLTPTAWKHSCNRCGAGSSVAFRFKDHSHVCAECIRKLGIKARPSKRWTEGGLTSDGIVSWRIDVPLRDDLDRQDGVTVRSVGDAYPVDLTMKASDLRALHLGEEAGTAEVELPLRVEVEPGKELIRDSDGRAQGAVDRTFASVTWDRSQSA